MKIVKEDINEKFTEDSDPIEDMGIGIMRQIKHWVETETEETLVDKNLLWICAKYGKVDFVKYLLKKGYDVHTENDRALRWASANGHAEVVKLLIDAGANVHAVYDEALRRASHKGHVEIVKLLLDAGADVHVHRDWALRWASANGHAEIVKLLLDAGANVHAENDYALRDASRNGHVEVVKLLLDAGADVHAAYDDALGWASLYGHTEVVKLLLDAGADVHAVYDEALRYASLNGHAEVVKLLRDHIAKENKSNKIVKEGINEKFTEDSDPIEDMGIGIMRQIKHWVETETEYKPIDKNLLCICAERGKVDFVKYLLKKGYNVHTNNDYALRFASTNGHTEIVKLLIDAGADVHAYDDYALLYASSNGHTEVVKLLLDAGADVHAKSNWALRFASSNGHAEIVKLLLDAGADVHAKNDHALRYASFYGHTEVVKLLLDAGANVHADNDYALGFASYNGHAEIVKLLKDHIAKEKKSNKIVKESINEKFTQDSDPIDDLGIGMLHQLKEWLKSFRSNVKITGKIENLDEEIKEDIMSRCINFNKHEFVQYLLDHGICANYISNKNDKNFGTYLMNAAYLKHWKTARILVNNGADLEKTIEKSKQQKLHKTHKELLRLRDMIEKNKI